MLFVTVVGIIGLVDIEWFGNTFKLVGAIHVLFAIKLDLPIEILFGAFLGCGVLGLLGTFILKGSKKAGYWIQMLSLVPLFIMAVWSTVYSSDIKSFTGTMSLVMIYFGLFLIVTLLFLNWIWYRKVCA